MQFFHLSHKSYLFKLIFNIFTILFILAQDNSIKIDICIISPNPIMWYQSSKPPNELLLCPCKLSLLCSLDRSGSPVSKVFLWHLREALWGTPHQCGLVIPATLYDGYWRTGPRRQCLCSVLWHASWDPQEAHSWQADHHGGPPGFPWPARPTRPPLEPPEHHLSPVPGQTIQPVLLPSRPRLSLTSFLKA